MPTSDKHADKHSTGDEADTHPSTRNPPDTGQTTAPTYGSDRARVLYQYALDAFMHYINEGVGGPPSPTTWPDNRERALMAAQAEMGAYQEAVPASAATSNKNQGELALPPSPTAKSHR